MLMYSQSTQFKAGTNTHTAGDLQKLLLITDDNVTAAAILDTYYFAIQAGHITRHQTVDFLDQYVESGQTWAFNRLLFLLDPELTPQTLYRMTNTTNSPAAALVTRDPRWIQSNLEAIKNLIKEAKTTQK